MAFTLYNLTLYMRDRLDIQSDAALAFINRNYEDPFFLYLAYFAPHVPLASSEKYLSRFPGEMPERQRYALAAECPLDWRFWAQGAIRIGDWKYLAASETEYLFNLKDNPPDMAYLY